ARRHSTPADQLYFRKTVVWRVPQEPKDLAVGWRDDTSVAACQYTELASVATRAGRGAPAPSSESTGRCAFHWSLSQPEKKNTHTYSTGPKLL
ncbi:unnamed protein product, partial [Pylaiella littoralis]